MELTRYTPIFSNPSRLLSSFLGMHPFGGWLNSEQRQTPAVNIHESDQAYEIEVAAPGLKKEHFSLLEENGLLQINCTVEDKQKETNTDNQLVHEEFNYLNWSRSIQLPKAEIDSASIKASYKEGVLQVHIPRRKEAIQSKQNISIE